MAFSCRPTGWKTWRAGPRSTPWPHCCGECPPDSAEAAKVVNRILEPYGWSDRREELLAGLQMLFEPRIERYWQLTAIINGLAPFPTYAPAFEWLIAALRAHE